MTTLDIDRLRFRLFGMYCDLGSLYVSFIDHQVGRTMVAVVEALITDALRLCSTAMSGTVGVILRIANCLMNPRTRNLLSLSQFQMINNVFVNLTNASASMRMVC